MLDTNDSEHKDYQPLNLDRLQFWIESGRIDATQTITMKHLLDSRCIHNIEDGVKLLGDVSFLLQPFAGLYMCTTDQEYDSPGSFHVDSVV